MKHIKDKSFLTSLMLHVWLLVITISHFFISVLSNFNIKVSFQSSDPYMIMWDHTRNLVVNCTESPHPHMMMVIGDKNVKRCLMYWCLLSMICMSNQCIYMAYVSILIHYQGIWYIHFCFKTSMWIHNCFFVCHYKIGRIGDKTNTNGCCNMMHMGWLCRVIE